MLVICRIPGSKGVVSNLIGDNQQIGTLSGVFEILATGVGYPPSDWPSDLFRFKIPLIFQLLQSRPRTVRGIETSQISNLRCREERVVGLGEKFQDFLIGYRWFPARHLREEFGRRAIYRSVDIGTPKLASKSALNNQYQTINTLEPTVVGNDSHRVIRSVAETKWTREATRARCGRPSNMKEHNDRVPVYSGAPKKRIVLPRPYHPVAGKGGCA